VNVHAEDQKRARELLEFLDDVFVAFAGRDDLIDPRLKNGMSAGGSDLEAGAFGGGDEFTARAMHTRMRSSPTSSQILEPVSTIDWCISCLTLLDDVGRGGGDELQHVRTQLARRRINDLKFFFDADREAVSQ